ncbi:peptidoglycan editing factor PgeF [Populibacterium corticicola]|uniref:Purine nucleoside phosphorylase n=1 Tax=Populibacterium corticicola TaxID=1812826 RepID=A0ABW5XIW2_9MICO
MSSLRDIPVAEVDLGPGISAFFTTARGGESSGPYASLNLGSRVGDDPVAVAANRRAVSDAAGVPLVYGRQVHSNGVFEVDGPTAQVPDTEIAGDVAASADALVSARYGVGLTVYIADCVPILFADADAGVIATAHAGRPGLEAGVIAAAVHEMAAHGATPASIRAAVGPCICANCYEVPADMAQDFATITRTQVSLTKWGSVGVDLRAAAERQLRELGIGKILHISECTYEHAEHGRLFSHRWATHNVERTNGKSGRFAGVIMRTPAE